MRGVRVCLQPRNALKPVRRFLAAVFERNAWRRKQNTGEMEAGLLIYPLIVLGRLLDDSSLSELAQRSAQLMAKKLFDEDKHFDIFQGTAGVLLGVLAVHRAEPCAETLATAICAGEHLLRSSQSNVAGRALALNRLCDATGDARFRIEGPEALAQDAWCRGAAGHGLSILASTGSSTADLDQDVEVALDASGRLDETNPDSLYEGLFAMVELQLECARHARKPRYSQIAQELAMRVVRTAGDGAQYRLYSRLPLGAYSPGFYQGMSGIGYELLRLHNPELLPSLLLWDVP